jgi:hypothetical protein
MSDNNIDDINNIKIPHHTITRTLAATAAIIVPIE